MMLSKLIVLMIMCRAKYVRVTSIKTVTITYNIVALVSGVTFMSLFANTIRFD